MHDLLSQRTFQIASGYEDGNDASTLYRDPLFKLAAEWAPLAAPAFAQGCGWFLNLPSVKAGFLLQLHSACPA